MSSILDRVKSATAAFFSPEAFRVSAEQKYLAEKYMSNEGAMRPNYWYRLANETGNTVGLQYLCACGFSVKMLNVMEGLRDYVCPSCHRPFASLTRQLEIDPDKVPVNQWATIINRLPSRPNITNRQSGSIKLGDWGDDTGDNWAGKPPQGSDGSWV